MNRAFIISTKLDSIITNAIECTLKHLGVYQNINQIKYNDIDALVSKYNISDSSCIYVISPDNFETIYNKIRKNASTPIILLGDHKIYSQNNVNQLIKLKNVGIINFNASANSFAECMHALESKSYYICSITKDHLINNLIEVQDQYSNFGFNRLERQILELAKQGYNIQMTAKSMELSKNTVAAYRSRMIKKADLRSFTELVFLGEVKMN